MIVLARPRVLCVCAHNRTRSVLMCALLNHHLAQSGAAIASGLPIVVSAGLGPPGMPITDGVAAALAAFGVDIGGRTSRHATERISAEAHLVLCADKSNVMALSTRARDRFVRTFTLPEFVQRATATGARRDRDIVTWVRTIGAGRVAAQYLQSDVPSIADPTGMGPAALEHCVGEIDRLCRRFVELWP